MPVLLMLVSGGLLKAESVPQGLMGDWTLSLSSGEAGWLSVAEKEGQPKVCMAVDTGSINPHKGVVIKEGTSSFVCARQGTGEVSCFIY